MIGSLDSSELGKQKKVDRQSLLGLSSNPSVPSARQRNSDQFWPTDEIEENIEEQKESRVTNHTPNDLQFEKAEDVHFTGQEQLDTERPLNMDNAYQQNHQASEIQVPQNQLIQQNEADQIQFDPVENSQEIEMADFTKRQGVNLQMP